MPMILPFLMVFLSMVVSLTEKVTWPVFTFSIAWANVSIFSFTSDSSEKANTAEIPCGIVFVGITSMCSAETSFAWFAAKIIFLLFGNK